MEIRKSAAVVRVQMIRSNTTLDHSAQFNAEGCRHCFVQQFYSRTDRFQLNFLLIGGFQYSQKAIDVLDIQIVNRDWRYGNHTDFLHICLGDW